MNQTPVAAPPQGGVIVSLAKESLQKKIPLRFKAKGNSMFPFIKPNDIITISPLQKNILGLGTVVAITKNNSERLFLHRIIRIKDNLFTTKGDNNRGCDAHAIKQEIIGYVSLLERNSKKRTLPCFYRDKPLAFLSKVGLLWVFTSFLHFIINLLPKPSLKND